jgi:type VI secretion system secreted protein VgrG
MSRTFVLHSPLGDDQLLFVKMTGKEALSTISEFELDCVSPSDSIDALDLLGQSVTIEITTQGDSPRYINAVITQFGYVGPDSSAKQLYKYKAKLRSWLFLADKSSDCRIFQNLGVDAIIKQVLGDFGLPFEMKLMESYAPREYCVMFNETKLNFVKRLAEEVGIYFFTKHDDGVHTIVFTDGGHMTLPDYAKIPFLTPTMRVMDIEEQVKEWHIEHQLRSGRYVTSSYNFKTPNAKLQKIDDLPKGHSHDALEIYEWHGRYPDLGEGAQMARVRREEQQQDFQTITAKSNVRGIMPGYYFKLSNHPVASNNAEYLIVSANYSFQENQQTDDSKETKWDVDFTAKPSSDRYQPPRVTTKPSIVGTHVAKVSGPAGSEIWCDSYGRVKVQFPWDRYGNDDENSSCWIRVSSPWAGSNFGGVHVPRIGQEVIVEHVGGDADQPIITGSVYNQNQMPPWDLPANATQSGVLSRSSPSGAYGNANAIRFEDKKGAEQVWIQAERNMDTVVEHDETHHVMHDRTKTIDHDETVFVHHDRTETVDNNETITVHNNRQERVDVNETISIGVNRTEDVGANETLKVGANRTEHIGANENVVIDGLKTETVLLAKAETIGLGKALSIGAAYAVTVGGAMNTAVGLAQFEEVGMDKSVKVVKSFTTTSGTTYAVQAGGDSGSKINMDGESITLVIGKSSITMNKSGEITIAGEKINLVGSDSINLTSPSINNN